VVLRPEALRERLLKLEEIISKLQETGQSDRAALRTQWHTEARFRDCRFSQSQPAETKIPSPATPAGVPMSCARPKTMENELPSPMPLPAWERVRVRAARWLSSEFSKRRMKVRVRFSLLAATIPDVTRASRTMDSHVCRALRLLVSRR
jgi:hypothetical protein